jgi:ATP-dependent Clp protease ATP-binding subunit ClpA
VQQRIQTASASKPFLVSVTESAREFLLLEGTDFSYGARPLKRAIERLLVQPLSNLMATGQIHWGDRISVSHTEGSPFLIFFREAGALEVWEVADRAAA